MSEYINLDKVAAAAREYAANEIAAGCTEPQETPFSGEWADGLTGQDVLNAAGIQARFSELGDFEQTDVIDSWESAYLAAWANR